MNADSENQRLFGDRIAPYLTGLTERFGWPGHSEVCEKYVGRVLDLYVFTYEPPATYLEPMIEFMTWVCRLGESVGLPIGICWNDVPRELRYTRDRWDRFVKRIRDGRVQTCLIVQFRRPGMSMMSFQGFALAPFSMDPCFIPAGGIPPDSRNSSFSLARRGGISRCPSALHLKIDTGTYETLAGEGINELFCRFGGLVTGTPAAVAWVEEGVMNHDYGTLPSGPELFDDTVLVQELDRRIPGVFSRMYLGPLHLKRLGGKGAALRLFADCPVDDLSSAGEDRICVQLTADEGAPLEKQFARYHPRFAPLFESE